MLDPDTNEVLDFVGGREDLSAAFLTPLAAKKKQTKFKCHFSKDNLLKLPKNCFSKSFKLKSLPTKKNKRISP